MIQFEGLYWAKGWKHQTNYNQRVGDHPTLVFYDDQLKKYYFFCLTSNKDYRAVDLLIGKKGVIRIKATMVRQKGKIYNEHIMSIIRYVAVIDADYVDTKNIISELGGVEIMSKYYCSNYDELIKLLFKILSYILRKDVDSLICYNGNNSRYEYPELKDSKLPVKLREFIHSVAHSS